MIYIEFDDVQLLRYKLSYPDLIDTVSEGNCYIIDNSSDLFVYLVDSYRNTREEFRFCDLVSIIRNNAIFVCNYKSFYYNPTTGRFKRSCSTIYKVGVLNFSYSQLFRDSDAFLLEDKGMEDFAYTTESLVYRGNIITNRCHEYAFHVIGLSKSGKRMILLCEGFMVREILGDTMMYKPSLLFFEGLNIVDRVEMDYNLYNSPHLSEILQEFEVEKVSSFLSK